jgi:hypothetical protein
MADLSLHSGGQIPEHGKESDEAESSGNILHLRNFGVMLVPVLHSNMATGSSYNRYYLWDRD